ncbi:MAG: toll/interleukin-1 receptor domain-containing protein [Dysgonamonadaceae bacterium]|jgi:hypothetical protein|nr:toll/interleukin-1 receptor domain-containing protein [Dysgonamonadaceae bacterium]
MELITKSKLKSIGDSYVRTFNAQKLSDSVNESKIRNSYYNEVTVFLSHKHSDTDELRRAIALFKRLGVSVYVDWMDEEMPQKTSEVTAQKIKQKIKANKKFVLLATEDAISSKWCNWELGYGDAHKYIEHIAILPVKSDYTDFSGSEYLLIYPVISLQYSFSDTDFIVTYPNGATKDLKQWLQA